MKNKTLMADSANKEHFSSTELAKLLGVSRIAIFKKIKSGQIKAYKVGRNYVISKSEFSRILGLFIPDERKREIDATVKKAIHDYKETFRLLGTE